MTQPEFTFEVVASILQDGAEREQIERPLLRTLERAGGIAGKPSDDGPSFVLVLTGGTEQQVLDLLAEREAGLAGNPTVLLAHPDNNSLPACLEILARIRNDGGAGEIIPIDDSERGVQLLCRRVAAMRAGVAIQRGRIGVVGSPSDWLVASAHSAEVVQSSWGTTLISIPVEEFRQSIGAPDRAAAKHIAGGIRSCVEPEEDDLAAAVSVVDALRSVVEHHDLDAITVRCFDLVVDDRLTACYAMAELADEGIPSGCEGDIPSVLALLWVKKLLGVPAWMANPTWIDPAEGEIHIAHCTVPRSMVTEVDLRSHFESGLGVAIQGDLRQGPVTLLRIGGKKLDEIFLTEGELVATPRNESRCRTQAVIQCDSGALGHMLVDPLGNHLVMVYGHHADLLRTSHSLIHR